MTLKIGDLVRAKVRTITGWKGTGTVTAISGDFVDIIKSDAGSEATFLMCQVARIKTQ